MTLSKAKASAALTPEVAIRIAMQYKLFVFACATVFAISGGYYAFSQAVPMFSSTAVVLLESRQEQVVDFESVVGGLSLDSSTVNTEVQILRSRSLARSVADKLNLGRDPEFNPSLQAPGFRDKIVRFIKDGLSYNNGDDRRGAFPDNVDERDRQSTVTKLMRAVQIRNVPQSLVFQITVETTDPSKSALIANTWADLYIENQINVKRKATQSATSWLSARVSNLKVQLEESEKSLAEFRTDANLVNEDSLAALEREFKDTRARLDNTKLLVEEVRWKLKTVEEAAEDRRLIAVTLNDDLLLSMSRRLHESGIKGSFDARVTIIVENLHFELKRYDQQVNSLQASVEIQRNKIEEQNLDLISLQQLSRESLAVSQLYEYFLTRLNQTTAQQGILQPDSRILSVAEVPSAPFSPRKFRIILVSALLGSIAGSALVIYYELRLRTYRSAQDLQDALSYPVIGELPKMALSGRKNVLKDLKESTTSAHFEAYRNLRTSLELLETEKPIKIIAVTSSTPGEGKTTTSMALAMTYAAIGKKTLLIECDIRRSVFKEYFADSPEFDLQSVISQSCTLSEAISPDAIMGVDVLFGRPGSENAADIFSSFNFHRTLKDARDIYDIIILDTAPVLLVPDARILAAQADATLLITQWNSTTHEQIEQSLRMLGAGPRDNITLALNKVERKKDSYYGYGYGAKY